MSFLNVLAPQSTTWPIDNTNNINTGVTYRKYDPVEIIGENHTDISTRGLFTEIIDVRLKNHYVLTAERSIHVNKLSIS